MIAGAIGIFHQLEQGVNNLLDPPQLRLCTMSLVTRVAGELTYEKSLLWSANQKTCMTSFKRTMGRDTDPAVCYLAEFIARPGVSVPLIAGVLLFAFAGRQLWNILSNVVEFRPENFTFSSVSLMLIAFLDVLGYMHQDFP